MTSLASVEMDSASRNVEVDDLSTQREQFKIFFTVSTRAESERGIEAAIVR